MLKKNSITLLLLVLISLTNGYSQSGFLGSTINVGAQVEIVPVFSAIRKPSYTGFQIANSGILKFKKTLVDFKFSCSGSKVLNDDLEIGLSLYYASFGIVADEFIGVDTNFVYFGYSLEEKEYDMLNVLKAKSTGISFNVKKFYKGLSPIGKFMGLNVGFSRTTNSQKSEVNYGQRDLISNRFLYKLYSADTVNSSILDYRAKVGTLNLNFLMGRTIPINKKLGIDITMSVPVFRVLFFNDDIKWAGSLRGDNYQINTTSAYELSRSIAYSIRRNQGFSVNVGVKYFL